MTGNRCEMCVNYMYDEDYECYSCLVSLDEDEMYRFLSGSRWECPISGRMTSTLLCAIRFNIIFQ